MDLSSYTPDLSNVLTADTLKAVGILMSLFAAKWAVGKAWAATKFVAKSLAASFSVIGVLSGLMVMAGTGITGFGLGEIRKPTNPAIAVFYNDGKVSPEVTQATAVANLSDFANLPRDQYAAKYGDGESSGSTKIPMIAPPDLSAPKDFVTGWTALGIGLGTLIVGAGSFIKKYG